MRIGTGARLALLFAVGCLQFPAAAEDVSYPDRPVNIIVPVTPGSPTDSLARIVADGLSKAWHEAVVVQNVPGGGQNIAAARVYRSTADGYTLMVSPPPALTVNHLLYKDIAYDPGKFTPITLLAKAPNVLIVPNDFGPSSVKELIAFANAHPDKVTFGSQGLGSTAYLAARKLSSLAGIKLQHVPYRGELPVLNDIMGGRLDMFFGTLSTAIPLYRAGKFKILAIADDHRSPAIPEVPTMAESGLSGFRSTAWWALVAPPGMSASLVKKVYADVAPILADSDIAKKLDALHLQGSKETPSETTAFIDSEKTSASRLLSAEKITPQ